jgi:hypothetical protein
VRGIGGRAPSSGELTPVERRVAELVAAGRSNREVAGARLVVVLAVVAASATRGRRRLVLR